MLRSSTKTMAGAGALVVFFVTACGSDVPAPTAATAPLGTHAAAPPLDVSGSWRWMSTEKLTMPPFVAEMFGIPVEGPVTHVRCESQGTLDLVQDGHTFEGSGARTTITCQTRGGFAFVPPPDFTLPFFSVDDGTVRGRSIHFRTGGPLPSLFHGVITADEAGVADALRATARTIVPGHPQSPIPLPPPPAGTSKVVEWNAVRL